MDEIGRLDERERGVVDFVRLVVLGPAECRKHQTGEEGKAIEDSL